MKTIGFGSALVLAMTALACGKPAPEASSSTLKVSGTVDRQSQALDNASAVAIGSDGRTFSAYLQRNGKFSLELPVGHVYRILITNSTMSGQLRPIGHLVNPTSRGKSHVIAVKNGGSLNLGTLRPAGSTSSSALHTACDCPGEDPGGKGSGTGDKGSGTGTGDKGSGDKSSDGDYGDEKGGDDYGDGEKGSGEEGDDFKCQQKDEDADRVCDSSSDVELEADHSPGDRCAKSEEDEDAPMPSGKACSGSDDSKNPGKGGDDQGSDSKGSDDGSGEKGGDASGGEKGGDNGSCSVCAPTSCTCSAQCGSGSTCVASHCTPDSSSEPSKTPSK
jgi:hypothetical protein